MPAHSGTYRVGITLEDSATKTAVNTVELVIDCTEKSEIEFLKHEHAKGLLENI